MKINKIQELLEAKIFCCEQNLDKEVSSVFGCDLMSDVLAYVQDQSVLLTGLVNPQVVRTCEMMDIKVICFVRGKVPGENIIELAKEMGITILTTKNPLFITCGKLYSAGITGKGVWD